MLVRCLWRIHGEAAPAQALVRSRIGSAGSTRQAYAMGRNRELIRQWTLLQKVASERGPHDSEPRGGGRSEPTHDPPRPQRPPGSRIPSLRRHDQRHQGLAGRSEVPRRPRAKRSDVQRAVRALLQPRVDRVLRGHAFRGRRAERARQVRVSADAANEEVHRPPAGRSQCQAGGRQAPSSKHLPDGSVPARCDSPRACRQHALPLADEPDGKGLRDSSLSVGACAGRARRRSAAATMTLPRTSAPYLGL